MPIIEEVAVYGIMDDHHEEVVKARIVLKADVNNQEEFILQHCKRISPILKSSAY